LKFIQIDSDNIGKDAMIIRMRDALLEVLIKCDFLEEIHEQKKSGLSRPRFYDSTLQAAATKYKDHARYFMSDKKKQLELLKLYDNSTRDIHPGSLQWVLLNHYREKFKNESDVKFKLPK
jgi:hypothetical protein